MKPRTLNIISSFQHGISTKMDNCMNEMNPFFSKKVSTKYIFI